MNRMHRNGFTSSSKALSMITAAAVMTMTLTGCGSSSAQQSVQSAAAASTAAGAAASGTAASGTAASGGKFTTTKGANDGTIKIGVISAMTGGGALVGEGAQNAVDMAVAEINASNPKYPIEIVNGGKVADDARDAKQAMNAYNLIMAESPDVIVGSYFSVVTLPIAQQAAKDGMMVLSPGATNYAITLTGPSIFRDCFIDPYQGKMATIFAKSQGWTKAAVIYAKDDDYSNGLRNAFVTAAPDNGLTVSYQGEYTSTDTDFSSQAAQAAASGADLVYVAAQLDAAPLVVSALRNAGYEGAIMGGDAWDGCDTTGLEDKFNNCYYTNHYSSEDTSPAVQKFVKDFTAKYGTETLLASTSLYYDAIYMVEQAAVTGGGDDTQHLVDGMTGMTFTGVGGTYTMDENGDPQKSVVINQYKDGKVKWLETMAPDGTATKAAE